MPLDGGQLVRLAALNGRRNAIMVFKLISILVFFTVASIFPDPIVALLGVILSFDLFNEIRQRYTLKKYENTMHSHNADNDMVESAFVALASLKATFQEKVNIVTQLLDVQNRPSTDMKTALGIAAVYLAVIIVPVKLGYTSLQSELLAEYDVDYEQMETVAYWNREVDAKTNSVDKIDTMFEASYWLEGSEHTEASKVMLVAASELAIGENLAEQHSMAQLRLIEHAFYQDDPDEAMMTYQNWIDRGAKSGHYKGLPVDQEHLEEAVYMLSTMEDAQLAHPFILQRVEMERENGDDYDLFDSYALLAQNNIDQNQDEKAKDIVNAVLVEELLNKELIEYAVDDLVGLYLQLDDHASAQKYAQFALDSAIEYDSYISMSHAAHRLGWLALMRNESSQANLSFKQARKFNKVANKEIQDSVGWLGKFILDDDLAYVVNQDYMFNQSDLVQAFKNNDKHSYNLAFNALVADYGQVKDSTIYYKDMLQYQKENDYGFKRTELILEALEYAKS